MKFEIYENLCKIEKYKKINKEDLCSIITNLPKEHSNIIYALIYHYYILKKNKYPINIPYKGKNIHKSNGVIFDLEKLPNKLIEIIEKYISLIIKI